MSDVQEAFQNVNRTDFVPDMMRGEAALDMPVPIGFGQTNSQPTVVQWMLEWLEVEPGNKIMDVGSGSGWTSALLTYLTSPKGKVFAVETIPELLAFGRENCRKAGITNVQFFQAGQAFGLPEHAPFDRILVSASANELPSELIEQLAPDGKMVMPVGETVLEITKLEDGELETTPHGGFLFVPLTR